MSKQSAVILLLVVVVAFGLIAQSGPGLRGTDDQAGSAIQQIRPDYKPWFTSLWEPSSPETEGLLFAVQAGIGAGFIGYCFGYWRGKSAGRKRGE